VGEWRFVLPLLCQVFRVQKSKRPRRVGFNHVRKVLLLRRPRRAVLYQGKICPESTVLLFCSRRHEFIACPKGCDGVVRQFTFRSVLITTFRKESLP